MCFLLNFTPSWLKKAFIYSFFEKGCQKKASKCTRQDRKVVWVFTGILHIGLEEICKFVFLHVENLFSSKGPISVALRLLSHVFELSEENSSKLQRG